MQGLTSLDGGVTRAVAVGRAHLLQGLGVLEPSILARLLRAPLQVDPVPVKATLLGLELGYDL